MADQLFRQQRGGWGCGSSHQVRRVQHGHPGRHAAVRVLNGLGAQEVTGGLVQHQLLALPAKERETESLQSTELVAFTLGSGFTFPVSTRGRAEPQG